MNSNRLSKEMRAFLIAFNAFLSATTVTMCANSRKMQAVKREKIIEYAVRKLTRSSVVAWLF